MFEVIVAALFGLLIGSFLNVCIYRLPRDLSVAKPRSHCPSCEKTIAWYDNIPVLSYLVLRGRCRHCGAGISWRYPLVEVVTGVCFAAAVAKDGPTLAAVKLCLFSAILIALMFADLEERILPDEFTKGGFVLGLLMTYLVPRNPGVSRLLLPASWSDSVLSTIDSVLAALAAAGSMWFVAVFYEKVRHKEGLGFGDVKMVAMIAAFLGLMPTLLALIIGSVSGALIGVLYIAVTRKDMSTYQLPFGTFIGAAALVAGFTGRRIIDWYLRVN